MTKIILAGILMVNLALIAYSVAIFTEQKTKTAGNYVLIFLTTGVVLDISATVCMIIGSTHTSLSSHGIFGYTALLGMLVDCYRLWKHRFNQGLNLQIKKSLHLYTRYAYVWWVLAYITGVIIIIIRHIH
jgi:hypothetical protein